MDNPKPSNLNQGQDISPEYNGQSASYQSGGLLASPFRNLLSVTEGSGMPIAALGTLGGAYYGFTKKGFIGAVIGLYVGSVVGVLAHMTFYRVTET